MGGADQPARQSMDAPRREALRVRARERSPHARLLDLDEVALDDGTRRTRARVPEPAHGSRARRDRLALDAGTTHRIDSRSAYTGMGDDVRDGRWIQAGGPLGRRRND